MKKKKVTSTHCGRRCVSGTYNSEQGRCQTINGGSNKNAFFRHFVLFIYIYYYIFYIFFFFFLLSAPTAGWWLCGRYGKIVFLPGGRAACTTTHHQQHNGQKVRFVAVASRRRRSPGQMCARDLHGRGAAAPAALPGRNAAVGEGDLHGNTRQPLLLLSLLLPQYYVLVISIIIYYILMLAYTVPYILLSCTSCL